MIEWFLAISAIYATILNIRKDRDCFLIWLCTNFGWTVISFKQGRHAQGVLFLVMAATSIVGYLKWRNGGTP